MSIKPGIAPVLSDSDGLTSLERAKRNRLMLGLFLPIQDGGWSPSTTTRETSWTFDYNAELAVRAEELGFDLVFGLAQWLGKGGYGGRMHYRELALDPLMVTAGLASVTSNILLISTVHILYGWHPLQVAKLGASLDHMSHGRWGLNVVTGYKPGERRMFGLDWIEHDLRYEMADEFTEIMHRLWTADENLTYVGKYWRTEKAFVTPKPLNGRPILVNAGSSPAGIRYAAKHADLMFITSPGGSDVAKACTALPDHIANIKTAAAQHGRQLKTLINPHVICRETEKEAKQQLQAIVDGEDPEAIANFVADLTSSDITSWKGHRDQDRARWAVGGNLQIVGSPEQVVDWMIKLNEAGCDGLQICFFDFKPDLEFFGARVLPLMKQAGLRLS